jgi:hypothetical protein
MPNISLSLAVRPVRPGLLIRAGEFDDFERAVGICTSLWDGQFAPIIPVGELADDSLDRLVREFAVDVLVAVTQTDATTAVISRHRHLHWEAWPPEEPLVIDTGFGEGKSPQFRLFDISAPAYQYWWDEGRHSNTRGLLPRWPRDVEDSAMLSATFGQYPGPDSGLPILEADFERAVTAETVEVQSLTPSEDWVTRVTPIEFTRTGLGQYRLRGLAETGLVLGDGGRLNDLIAFWNLRAGGARVMFCATGGPGNWAGLYRAFLERSLARLREQYESYATLWICHHAAELEPPDQPNLEVSDEIQAMVPEETRLGIAPIAVGGPWGRPEWPGQARTASKPVLATIEEQYGRQYISAQLSGLPFPDGRVHSRRYMQNWMLSLESPSVAGAAEGWTLKIPNVPELNEWYSRQVFPVHVNGVRVHNEGLDLMTGSTEDTLGIFPLREEDVVSKLMERAGVKMSLSSPGRLSQRIVSMVGGRPQTAIFRVAGVRKLLSSNDVRSGVPFSRAVEIVRDKDPATGLASFEKFKGFWRDISPEELVRTLIAWEVLRPGLRLTCPNCELRSVIDVDEVGQRVTCPLCADSFLIGPRLTGREWVFRSSGVFAREGGPQGAIPGLLVAGELARGAWAFRDERAVLPAHDLTGAEIECESDLIALEVSLHESFPSVCVGECKTAGFVSQDDIENLATIRRLMRETGVECYIVLAVLRERFTDEELELIQAFAESTKEERALGLPFFEYRVAAPMILFVRDDLESDPIFAPKPAPDRPVPHDHPMSFRDFAENSRALYYPLPPRG